MFLLFNAETETVAFPLPPLITGYKLAFNYLKGKRYVDAIDVCHKVEFVYVFNTLSPVAAFFYIMTLLFG